MRFSSLAAKCLHTSKHMISLNTTYNMQVFIGRQHNGHDTQVISVVPQ